MARRLLADLLRPESTTCRDYELRRREAKVTVKLLTGPDLAKWLPGVAVFRVCGLLTGSFVKKRASGGAHWQSKVWLPGGCSGRLAECTL